MVQDSAEAFIASDDTSALQSKGQGDDVVEALMVALMVIMLDVLAEDRSKMSLPERDDVAKTFGLERADKAFGVRVEVWASRCC
jgi:hypothetical protein